TFRRYCHQGSLFTSTPSVRIEVDEGRLVFEHAMFVMESAGSDAGALRAWVALARRLGGAELRHARSLQLETHLREEYGPAVAMAEQVEEALRRFDEAREA